MDYSALRITANLVVSSWAYLLSIHSCLLDFLLAARVIGNKLASGVLEAIAIGLIKQRENSNKVLEITSECKTNSD